MNNVTFGDNKFCGPSVISAICGINTDEAAAVLLSIVKRDRPRTTDIKGVYCRDLTAAFNQLGYNATIESKMDGSVFMNLFSLVRKAAQGYYVFMVPQHFIAIELNGAHKYICDNHSKTPVNMGSSARLGQQCVAIIKVTKR